MAASVVTFGEWLPDQPELGHQGLIVAKNVLPADGGYKPFLPINPNIATLAASSVGGALCVSGSTKGSMQVYAFSGTTYYEGFFNGAFTARGTVAFGDTERFAQFENLIVGVGGDSHLPTRHTLGALSTFTTLAVSGSAPYAECVGVINKFLVLGSLGTAGAQRLNSIAWSAIDDPTNWPTPNSATAIAVQSGEQDMPLEFGNVQAIHGGDQNGVILQQTGVSRMTYVGPPVVFQFDVIDNSQGSYFPTGSIRVGNITYFISTKGFCRTDGVAVERIGDGKVDRYFWETYFPAYRVMCGYDPVNELVIWAFPTASLATKCDTLIIYSPSKNAWSYALQDTLHILTPPMAQGQAPRKLLGFSVAANSILGEFAATAGAATLATADTEFNPGGRAFLSGVKPNVESSGTAPAITVRVGSREDLGTTPSYTATTTPTPRTGFADVRVDAKYHRAEVQIVGNFEKASGLEFRAQGSGEA